MSDDFAEDNFENKFEQIKKDLPGKITRLENLLRKYDPFNVIATIALRQHVFPASNPKVPVNDQLPVVVEYITLLYLKQPYYFSAGEFIHSKEMLPDITEIMSLAEEIVYQNSLFLQDIEQFDPNDTLQNIAHSLATEEYFVRNPAIEEHHWIVFEELFTQHDGFLKNRLGFNTADARDLCECIQEFMYERFQEMKKEYTSIWTQMFNEIMAFKRKGKKPINFYPDDILKSLSSLTEIQIKTHFQQFAEQRITHFTGEKLSFNAQELSEFAGIEHLVVNNFLDAFTSKFNTIDPKFENLQVTHELKNKPIISNEGRFLCPSISLLDWAVDKLFTDTLIKGKPIFSHTRHDYILEKGMRLLLQIIPKGIPYQELKYNDGNSGEMDGLILYDNYGIFIEVKGNSITDKAKAGNRNKIKDHIDKIIDFSHQQAVRAANYFKSGNIKNYKDKKGHPVSINSEKTSRFFYVSLTLDPISNISNNIKVNNSLDLFGKGTIPWVVNLYDLMVVADFIDAPSFLIHFLIRRNEFFKADKMRMTDELDVLIYYLNDGLHFDDLNADETITHYEFQSMSSVINDYYFAKSGLIRKNIKKPAHYANFAIKSIVHNIDKLYELPNQTDFTIELLSLSTKAQKQFVEQLAMYKKRYLKDRQIHDFSLTGTYKGEIWGLTYFFALDINENHNVFHDFCRKKVVDRSADRWVGIFDAGQKDSKFVDSFSFVRRTEINV